MCTCGYHCVLDDCIEIPQLKFVRSLNVYVNGVIVGCEYGQQQRLGLISPFGIWAEIQLEVDFSPKI